MSELYIAVTGLLLLLLIGYAVVAANKKQKQKKEKTAALFHRLTQEHALVIDAREEQRFFVLGLDRSNKKLLYIKDPGGNEESLVVDLKALRQCRTVDKVQSFYMDDDKKRSDTLTTQIALEMVYAKSGESLLLPFYDYISNNVSELQDLRALATSWERRVKEVMADKA